MSIIEDKGHHGPNYEKIQCTTCKHRTQVEWEGKQLNAAGSAECKKFTRKPKGVLYPINKTKENMKGVYIKCPCYEPED